MILITKFGTSQGYKMVGCLTFDENSYIRNFSDTKYFKNIFVIFGKEGSLSLCADTKKNKTNLINIIENNIFKNLQEKHELKTQFFMKSNNNISEAEEIIKKMSTRNIDIRVKVIGTCIREKTKGFLNFTLYIVEISSGRIEQRIFLRFNQLMKLENALKEDFPNFIIPELPKKSWFESQKSKTIESRKIHMEQFLQVILQNSEVGDNPDRILGILGLPSNFYNLSDSLEDYGLKKNQLKIFITENLFLQLFI